MNPIDAYLEFRRNIDNSAIPDKVDCGGSGVFKSVSKDVSIPETAPASGIPSQFLEDRQESTRGVHGCKVLETRRSEVPYIEYGSTDDINTSTVLRDGQSERKKKMYKPEIYLDPNTRFQSLKPMACVSKECDDFHYGIVSQLE